MPLKRLGKNMEMKMKAILLNTIENIMAKEKISNREQFLHMPQCFRKTLCIEMRLELGKGVTLC